MKFKNQSLFLMLMVAFTTIVSAEDAQSTSAEKAALATRAIVSTNSEAHHGAGKGSHTTAVGGDGGAGGAGSSVSAYNFVSRTSAGMVIAAVAGGKPTFKVDGLFKSETPEVITSSGEITINANLILTDAAGSFDIRSAAGQGALNVTINGNVTIDSLTSFVQTSTAAGGAITIQINGDLVVSGGATASSFGDGIANAVTVVVSGDLVTTSPLTLNRLSLVTVNGNVTCSALITVGEAAVAGAATLVIRNDLTLGAALVINRGSSVVTSSAVIAGAVTVGEAVVGGSAALTVLGDCTAFSALTLNRGSSMSANALVASSAITVGEAVAGGGATLTINGDCTFGGALTINRSSTVTVQDVVATDEIRVGEAGVDGAGATFTANGIITTSAGFFVRRESVATIQGIISSGRIVAGEAGGGLGATLNVRNDVVITNNDFTIRQGSIGVILGDLTLVTGAGADATLQVDGNSATLTVHGDLLCQADLNTAATSTLTVLQDAVFEANSDVTLNVSVGGIFNVPNGKVVFGDYDNATVLSLGFPVGSAVTCKEFIVRNCVQTITTDAMAFIAGTVTTDTFRFVNNSSTVNPGNRSFALLLIVDTGVITCHDYIIERNTMLSATATPCVNHLGNVFADNVEIINNANAAVLSVNSSYSIDTTGRLYADFIKIVQNCTSNANEQAVYSGAPTDIRARNDQANAPWIIWVFNDAAVTTCVNTNIPAQQFVY